MAHPSVTLHLKKEHEIILHVLETGLELQKRFQETKDIFIEKFKELLFFFKEFADKLHHRKEEEILFPYLDALPQLSGGPHCTYYSGLRLMREAVHEQVKEINRSLCLKENEGIPQIKEGNPLNPIIEEHLLGRKLAAAMQTNLERFEEDHQKDHLIDFFRYFAQYDSLLREHITKENECLFYMVDQNLSLEIQSKILRNFEAMDQSVDKNTIAKLERALSIIL